MTRAQSLRRYDLLDEDLKSLALSARHDPNYVPGTNAITDAIALVRTNAAWRKIGDKYRFKWDTPRPAPGYGPEVFLAEPLPIGWTNADYDRSKEPSNDA